MGTSLNSHRIVTNSHERKQKSIGTARLNTIADHAHTHSKDSKERVYRLGHSSSEKKKKLSKKKSAKTRL